MVIGVCSNKPRPQVQNNYTGGAGQKGFATAYAKDPWHVRKSGTSTLCGIDSSEWLTIGELEPDHNLCGRCMKKLGLNPEDFTFAAKQEGKR